MGFLEKGQLPPARLTLTSFTEDLCLEGQPPAALCHSAICWQLRLWQLCLCRQYKARLWQCHPILYIDLTTLSRHKSHAAPVWSWHHVRCCKQELRYHCGLPAVQPFYLWGRGLVPALPVMSGTRQLRSSSLLSKDPPFHCRCEVHRWRHPSSPRHLQPVAQRLPSGCCRPATQRWGPPGAGAVTCSLYTHSKTAAARCCMSH